MQRKIDLNEASWLFNTPPVTWMADAPPLEMDPLCSKLNNGMYNPNKIHHKKPQINTSDIIEFT
jgi:hypothetical protein